MKVVSSLKEVRDHWETLVCFFKARERKIDDDDGDKDDGDADWVELTLGAFATLA